MRVLTKNQNPKVSRRELREATIYMYRALRGRKSVSITIESRSMAFSIYGMAQKTGLDTFLIQINSRLSRKNQLLTLAHELVHVRQYVKGELRCALLRGAVMTKWKGKFYDETRWNYHNLPWEVEACSFEDDLLTKYMASIDL